MTQGLRKRQKCAFVRKMLPEKSNFEFEMQI